MRKFLFVLITALVALLALVVVRTVRFVSPGVGGAAAQKVAVHDGAASRLGGAIRLRTVSPEDPTEFDAKAFSDLHAYLATAFPRLHSTLRREVVGAHSLLYTWTGIDSSLKPILLSAHMDVVPVEPGTERAWRQEPYGGRIADGFIWGRGAIDNKSAVVGMLEAVELLVNENFRPSRTVYLAFGHDEEVGGHRGARAIAELLRQRGVRLEMVLDEGGVIGRGVVPGVAAPTALVGIAEKGFVSIELSASGPGGHSSLPPSQTTIGTLSAAIVRLERNPMPARFEVPTRQLFERIGPELPLAQRATFANLWLTRPLVLRSLGRTPSTNAMVRTTTATTIFQGGTKDNVLPRQARAVINFRILQGDRIADVVDHVKRAVDDPRIEVRITGAFSAEPSPVSSTTSASFQTLAQSIRAIAPDAVVAPFLVVVVTDARHYADLSAAVFRFLPLRLAQSDLARIHGIDERVAVSDYHDAIRHYRQLIVSFARN